MQSESKNLHQQLIPNLNKCDACGITQCSLCEKYDFFYGCRYQRCKPCMKFFNSIEFFYQNATRDQWNYICNFLHDFFRLHCITKQTFKDVNKIVNSKVKNTCFIISDSAHINNNIVTRDKKRAIYYILGNKRYKFYFTPM